MNILISQMSQTPIYEQIENQVRQGILSGNLEAGENMPSIRKMAKELGVGIITVKRAYDDLCSEGLLVSLQGRGVFVAEIDSDREKEIRMEKLEDKLREIKEFCENSSIEDKEVRKVFDKIFGLDKKEQENG